MLNNCIVFTILHNALLLNVSIRIARDFDTGHFASMGILSNSKKKKHTHRQISSTISITSLGMRLRTVVCRIGDVKFKAAKHKNELKHLKHPQYIIRLFCD